MADEERPCPLCNCDTDWIFECPGYPGSWNGSETIMVCIDGCCCNAIEYFCTNKDCQWWHRVPNDRSDRAQMGIAPTWLSEALREFEEDDEDEAYLAWTTLPHAVDALADRKPIDHGR